MRDSRLHFYDTIADKFDAIANDYDTQRRVEIVFDDLLGGENLETRSLLDVGCGTGWFSARAKDRGARVTSFDIGTRLLARTRERCDAVPVAGDACVLPFMSDSFDFVISSECIEHTLDPHVAVREIHRVTRPGGLLVITTPNKVWRLAVTVANGLGLRPYEGYEHWLGWFELRRLLRLLQVESMSMKGFHMIPPVVPVTRPLLRRLDSLGPRLGPMMLNMALVAKK